MRWSGDDKIKNACVRLPPDVKAGEIYLQKWHVGGQKIKDRKRPVFSPFPNIYRIDTCIMAEKEGVELNPPFPNLHNILKIGAFRL